VSEHPATIGDDALLDRVQHDAYAYFVDNTDRGNGLVRDSTQPGSPCSISAVGFALSCHPVAAERGWITRAEALEYALAAVRFFEQADMSGSADATGHRGFYFHFLDMASGARAWRSELSSIDTAFLLAGMLMAACYFDRDTPDERALRDGVQRLWERVDWRWMQNGDGALAHGWTPEHGFLPYHWIGYSEALLLYALALGSPSYPATPAAYDEWLGGYRWRRIYGHEYVHAGPLFIHQYSHLWIDFRGIADRYMAGRGIDYFENSRRATLVQCEYAKRNPRGFRHYHGTCWGLTACDGPGPRWVEVEGRRRRLLGYAARGVPHGPDDGTVAPWASIASLPFAPEVVMPTIRHLAQLTYEAHDGFAFRCSFNPTWADRPGTMGWISPWHFGLNDGPIVLMIENHRSGLPWRLMRGCAPVAAGLRRAGFAGGWLAEPTKNGSAVHHC
jgi:hypothetical protein